MKTNVTVLSFNHYDMEGNRGLSANIVGSETHTNNAFGVDIVNVGIPKYDELRDLEKYASKLPAVFEADTAIGTIKDRSGKSKGGLTLANLKYLHSVKFTEVK